MTTITQIRAESSAAQLATIDRMQAAPAMKWIVTGAYDVTLLGVRCEGRAVRIEAPAARIWGVVLPDGSFVKPKPGRKTIDATDIAFKM